MKAIILILITFIINSLHAQELFVVTDPASNVPAGSVSVRLSNSLFKEIFEDEYNYHLMPEITWGISGKLMVRASAFVSNRSNSLYTEGGSIFTKYRFFLWMICTAISEWQLSADIVSTEQTYIRSK